MSRYKVKCLVEWEVEADDKTDAVIEFWERMENEMLYQDWEVDVAEIEP